VADGLTIAAAIVSVFSLLIALNANRISRHANGVAVIEQIATAADAFMTDCAAFHSAVLPMVARPGKIRWPSDDPVVLESQKHIELARTHHALLHARLAALDIDTGEFSDVASWMLATLFMVYFDVRDVEIDHADKRWDWLSEQGLSFANAGPGVHRIGQAARDSVLNSRGELSRPVGMNAVDDALKRITAALPPAFQAIQDGQRSAWRRKQRRPNPQTATAPR
jgi:hypothetical protein